MAPIQGPVLPRKRIAAELKRLREEAGLTLEQVAEALLVSTSKLSRLENAQGSPQARDVRDLINYYKIDGTELAAKLTRWTRASHRQGWWADYSDTITTDLDTHIAYESEASLVRVYTIPALPVLLQTPDYARAYYEGNEPWRSRDEINALVELRMRRQASLDVRAEQAPLKLVAITHESGLHQHIGSREIMRAQLDHMVDRSIAANVDLRVLPYTGPLPFTSTCSTRTSNSATRSTATSSPSRRTPDSGTSRRPTRSPSTAGTTSTSSSARCRQKTVATWSDQSRNVISAKPPLTPRRHGWLTQLS